MANTNTREAQQRARAKLAERRQREDQLIEVITQALVTREEATEALAAADASLAASVAGLADLGISRDELAAILEVPAEQLGAKTRGRPRKATTPAAPEAPVETATVDDTVAAPAPEAKPATGRARKTRAAARPPAGQS